MAYPVIIGGKRFLTELVWRDLSATTKKERQQEIRHLLSELSGTHDKVAFGYLQTHREGDVVSSRIGVIDETSGALSKAPKTPILAATIASLGQDGVYLIDLGVKDQYWYCAIQDGLIDPGSDIFIDADAVGAELLERLSLVEFPLPLYTNATDIDIDISSHTNISQIEPLDVVGIATAAKPLLPTRIYGANYRAIAAGLGLFVIAEAWILLSPSAPPDDANRALAQAYTPEEIHALQVREFVDAINSRYNTNGLFTSPLWVLQAFDVINEMSARLPGWTFDDGRCTPAKGCRFTWHESPLSSTALMRETLDTGIGVLEVDAATRQVSLLQMGATLWPTLGVDTTFAVEHLGGVPRYKAAQAVITDYCRQWSMLSTSAKCTFKDPQPINVSANPETQGFSFWSVTIENNEPGALLHLIQDVALARLNISEITYAPIKDGASYWKAEVAYVAKE